MAYRIVLRPAAQRDLQRLRGPLSIALHGALLALADDPRSHGALKLTGVANLWRVRLRIDRRPWRVIYQIDDRDNVVRVLRVVPRDEGTYRGL